MRKRFRKERLRIFENIINFGIATIAAVLEDNGISVKIVDLTLYRGNLIKDLQTWRPSIIGIGGTLTTIGAIKLKMEEYDRKKINGLEVNSRDVNEI